MQSKAATVAEYLKSLPADRRAEIEVVRKLIRANLPPGLKEGMQYGMIGWYVPHSIYPPGYHCDPKQPLPYAGLASQKNHLSLYLMCMYSASGEIAWFEKAWKATGKKLDMGKCCIRFKKADDLALDVLAEALRRMPTDAFIALYESMFKNRAARPAPKKPAKAAKTAKPSKAAKTAKPAKRG